MDKEIDNTPVIQCKKCREWFGLGDQITIKLEGPEDGAYCDQCAKEQFPLLKCNGCQQYRSDLYEVKWISDTDPTDTQEWLLCVNCKRAGDFNSKVYEYRRRENNE